MLNNSTTPGHKLQLQLNAITAKNLVKAGWAIFPADPSTKKPMPGVKWKEAATSDLDQVEAWWDKWPNAMPALPTGTFFCITRVYHSFRVSQKCSDTHEMCVCVCVCPDQQSSRFPLFLCVECLPSPCRHFLVRFNTAVHRTFDAAC